MAERSWSDLPTELLETILSKLPLTEHPYFSSVCKSWNRVIRPNIYPADECPLLVYFRKWRDGNFHYYSPLLNMTFKVDCALDLSNTQFCFTRDGWLVLYREHEVILANPLANVMHQFPGLPYLSAGIAFYGDPPDECTIFAIASQFEKHVHISIWDGEDWDSYHYDNNRPFIAASQSSPVVYDDCFYCLGMEGNLGVYDPDEETWTVLDKPNQFPFKVDESYLVESKGKLIAVNLLGNHNATFQLLRLHQRKMIWEKITTLKSETLFVGPQISLLTTTRMNNTVFYSRLLGVPETIEAEIRYSDGRIFFVQKPHAHGKPRDGLNKANKGGGMYSYSLQNGQYSRYCGSIEYPCNIWYQPSIEDNL